MDKISDRVEGTVESWSQKWKGRARGWLGDVLSFGLDTFMNVLGKAFAPKLKPIIESIEATGEVPEELKPMLDEIKTPTGQVASIFAWTAGGSLLGGAIGKVIDALFLKLGYAAMHARHPVLPTPEQALAFWLRGTMEDVELDDILKSHGADDYTRVVLKDLAHGRLDVASVQELWRRDPKLYETLWKDIQDQGIDLARIAFLKELAKVMPPLADMVRFADFGSFDPVVIAKWREFYDAPSWIREPMSKIGIEGDWADKYWFSHWRQPGRFELGELHRREKIDDETVKMAYLTQGFSRFWQDLLLELVKEVPTRVDVRRFWDMRTIDEARLREIYHAQGYYGKDLDDYVRWTKVYTDYPLMMARFRNGWITEEDVYSWLIAQDVSEERARHFIEEKVKAEQPQRTAGEKDLTKTDIIKGVKKGVITRAEGVELLMDLKYDEGEAAYLLEINIPSDEEDEVVNQRQLTKADILKGLKTEVITMEGARDKLLELRYVPADVEFLLKIYQAQVKPPEEPRLKEASKADIVLGVKKGLITQEEGYGMLLDLDFSPEAANFILTVKTEESPFSPINYQEFKDLTQKWRKAVGMEVKPMPEELKAAADEVVRLSGDVESLKRSIEKEQRGLVEEEVLPAETTAKLDELRVTLHRAEAELAAARSHYNSLLAEWRHKET